jgi:hypothetical protein
MQQPHVYRAHRPRAARLAAVAGGTVTILIAADVTAAVLFAAWARRPCSAA